MLALNYKFINYINYITFNNLLYYIFIFSDDQTNIEIMSQSIAPLSIEAVNKLCDEKIKQICENQALVIKKIEEANDTFERSNVKIYYSTERAKSICDEKLSKIGQLRSELIEMINIANVKYEELKNFQ
jgi:Mg2+ and Co2+ transporter CorA